MPDLEPAAVPPTGLLRVQNLLPDRVSGQPQTRQGFKRAANFAVAGYKVTALHPYSRISDGSRYLIAVVTSGTEVQVWSYNLLTQAATKISPVGKVFNRKHGMHYGFVVDDTFYGGSEFDAMYSWNPTDGWNDNVSAPAAPAPAHSATKAYKKGDLVTYLAKVYSATRDLREEKWETGTSYERGEKVSLKTTGGEWNTYRARKEHDSAAANKPGEGADWAKHWKRIKMDPPLDEDGKPSKDWRQVPDAPTTDLAIFHGNRMWARHDNSNAEHLIFSEQARIVEDETLDAPTSKWDPTKWRISDDLGAGILPFKTEDGERIEALASLGYYLMVFKRHSTHVIAGVNPSRWTIRELDQVGAVSKNAVTTHNGLVYFVSDRGFHVTDGQIVEPVEGMDKVQDFIQKSLAWEGNPHVTLWSFMGLIWMTLPVTEAKVPDLTLVYDPATGSFWRQDIRAQAVAITQVRGIDQMFFSTPSKTGAFATATYAWTGTPGASTSTMTYTASPVQSRTNYLKNPGFEYDNNVWVKTSSLVSHMKRTKAAKYHGLYGMEVSTKAGAIRHGIMQSVTLPTMTTYRLRFLVRRLNWMTTSAAPPVSAYVEGAGRYDFTFTEHGDGWWIAHFDVVLSSGTHNVGIVVETNRTVEVDTAMLFEKPVGEDTNPTPGFDGDEGEDTSVPDGAGNEAGTGPATVPVETGIFEGGNGLIMQYGAALTDDTAQSVYAQRVIPWFLRTAWFAFGSMKELRRIRRTWVQVRGNNTVVNIKGYRNHKGIDSFDVTGTATEGDPSTFFEGRVIDHAFAVSFEISGLGDASVLGLGIETQPRYRGYHSRR